MRARLTAAAVVLVTPFVVVVPSVQASFLATLTQGTSYIFTFKNGDNNIDATGIVFLKVNRANKVSSADPHFIRGHAQTPIEERCESSIDAIVVLVSPSVDGANALGKITLTVTNAETGQNVVPAQTFTGDQQFSFECLP